MEYVQGSEEWLEMRRGYIMASDAPIIMGVSKYHKSLKDLWNEKLGVELPETLTLSQRNAMKYGQEREEYGRILYQSKMGISMVPKVIFSEEHSFLGASLDGISEDGKKIIEIKTTNHYNHSLAKEGKIPEEFYPQLQHQMLVAQVEDMDYISLYKNEIEIVKVIRDNEYIATMLEKHHEFWRCVEDLVPPEEEVKERVKRSLEEWEEEVLLMLKLEEQKKKLEDAIKALKEKLTDEVGRKEIFGNKVSLMIKTRKGRIDYTAHPMTQNICWEEYRTNPVQFFVFQKNEKKS